MFFLNFFFRSLVLACGFWACLAGPASADSFLKQVAVTEPFEVMGEFQPGMIDTSTTWMAKDRVYSRSSEGISIARFDLGVVYALNPETQTYTEMPLSMLTDWNSLMDEIAAEDEEFAEILKDLRETGSSEELDEALAELGEDPEMAELLEGMLQLLVGGDGSEPLMTAQVTPTDEYGQYDQWEVRKYLVTMTAPMIDELTSEIWATTEIDACYEDFMQATMGMAAGWSGFAEAMEEFKKIEGMAVYSEVTMSMMGFELNIISELIEYRQADPPAGIYEVPDGYTEVSLGEAAMEP